MKPQLFFGTNNPGKLKEINEILGDQFDIMSFRNFEEPFDVEETEPTLEGNAELKARAFFRHTGIPCFADDTGLEVEALDGMPGVITARYAGPQCSPDDNMDKLLGALEGENNRKAQFRTVVAYFNGEGLWLFEGIAKGNIRTERSGEKGFGYDPVFEPEGFDRTFAELLPEEKNRISHRGQAVREFASFIKKKNL